jgi:methyl-accepting chemotaxis protein
MRLKLKLPLAIAAATLAMLGAALYGIFTLQRAVDSYSTTVSHSQARAREADAISILFKTQVQEWKNTLLRGRDAKAMDRHWAAFNKLQSEVAQKAQKLEAELPAGDSRTLIARFGHAHRTMAERYAAGFQAFKAADFDHLAGDKAVQGMDREPAKLLDEANQRFEADAAAQSSAAASVASRATIVSLGLMVVVAVAGIVAGVAFMRTISAPLDESVRCVRRIEQGDLSLDLDSRRRDELGVLMTSLQAMQVRLRAVVGDVRANAESVSTASAQIAQGNADLSQRTEEQASSLQQTAATMEQLGATARLNNDSARQADQLAQSASAVALQGGEVVAQVVDTMRGISDSSHRIAEIIGTIDGIAFQTNILALNAAVEAARAGEQGRGFAVVAGEVRSLAQRSAEAAREIKGLISASVERVEQGSALVGRAGQTMDEVVASIKRVSDIVGEISNASVQQSSGVQQVGDAVGQMDQVTQQNAALVEQSAAAAASLKLQASSLVQAVGVFRLA